MCVYLGVGGDTVIGEQLMPCYIVHRQVHNLLIVFYCSNTRSLIPRGVTSSAVTGGGGN